LQDHVMLKMSAFEGYGCHDDLPSSRLRLTHPAICDRTLMGDPFRNSDYFLGYCQVILTVENWRAYSISSIALLPPGQYYI
jgi:hypothetical protein